MSTIEGNYNLSEAMLGSLQQPQQNAGLSRDSTQNLLRAEGDASSFSNYAQRLAEIDQELQQSDNASAKEGFRNIVQSFAENPDQTNLDSFVQANNRMESEEREEFAATAQDVQEQGGRELMQEWSDQASRTYNQDSQIGSQFVQASNQVLEVSANAQDESAATRENMSSFLELSSRTEQAQDDQSMLQEFLNDVQSSENNEQMQGVYQDYYQRVSEAA